MLPDSPKNKMIDPSANSAVEVTLKAVSGIKNEYHFPGVPEWKPLAVVASTYEEALGIWKQLRTPAIPETPAKVEPAEETVNSNE